MSSNTKTKAPLSRDQWHRVTELFEQAMGLPADARMEFVDKATKETPELLKLKAELLFLIRNSSAESFLEAPVGPRLAQILDPKLAASRFSPGDTVDDFEIIRLLGSGGFAKVFLARQISLDREVALKISANEGQEAKTMAHLEHDHIIKVFSESVDFQNDVRFLCMQYVPGVGLEKVIAELGHRNEQGLTGADILDIIDTLGPGAAPFNPAAMKNRQSLAGTDYTEACLWIGARLADALAYAHERGVLHLDVKPSNILLSLYGRPLLSDFNVSLDARVLESDRGGRFGGTANYMSPEQKAVFTELDKSAALRRIDGRADIYSLGIVLRELISADRSEISPEVSAVLDRATAPDPEHRFRSAAELGRALESCLELRSIAKSLPRTDGRFFQIAMEHPLLALTLVGAVPQLLASYVGIMYNELRVVPMLTPEQRNWFHWLNLYYNPVIYGVATVVWLGLILHFRNYLKDPISWAKRPRVIAKLRRQALHLPLWGVAMTTFGWVPSAIVFPLVLHLKAGPLPGKVLGHFLILFTLSWLIAMGYSFLCHQFLVVRMLYPRFWVGCSEIRKTAREELRDLRLQSRVYYFIAWLIPLFAAGILMFIGPDKLESSAYQTFRFLVTSLIALGVVGVFFASWVSDRVAQTTLALTAVQAGNRRKR